jgi:hypothetical protein
VRIGNLEFIANPGEAFPSLIRGSHWGQSESCDTRENPPVPTYYSTARYRWDMGLANDMAGYELPAWGWDESAAVYTSPDDPCSQQESSGDKGHKHALESESLGPAAGNFVAKHLVALIEGIDGADANEIARGRYLFSDGTLSRRPYEAPFDPNGVVSPTRHAVGIVSFEGSTFHTYALPSFDGPFEIEGTGGFVDFDGLPQLRSNQTTRGMAVAGNDLFLDVWPDLDTLGAPGPEPSPPAEPLTVSITSNRRQAGYRRAFRLSGEVGSGTGCSGPYTVSVSRKRYNGGSYKEVATVLSQADGRWSLSTRARVNGSYRAIARGGNGCVSEESPPVEVKVRVRITAHPPRSCRGHESVAGRVIPQQNGTRVALQRLRFDGKRRWVFVDRDRLDRGSRYLLTSNSCRGFYRVKWRRQSASNAAGHHRFHF